MRDPSPKQTKKLMEKGDLLDSLDLNIGYESIQKLKDNWGFGVNNFKNKQAAMKEEEPDFDRNE